MEHDLPDAHFGSVGAPPIDWRKAKGEDAPDDDEPLAKTPEDVVGMLGFDPLDDDE